MGAHWRHLVNTVEPTVLQRCGIVSNYLNRLLLFIIFVL